MNKKHIIAILAFSAALAVAGALAGCGRSDDAGGGGTMTLTNVSYDPTRELYKEYNELFQQHYRETTGKDIRIIQSHGGSGSQARSVIEGSKADVVTLALAHDVSLIERAGLIHEGWQGDFANDSAPYTSTIVFLVRKGNPKGIRDWDDLVKPALFFGGAGRLLGVIAVADTIKEDSPEAIRQLQNMGIRVVMLTGDNQRTADAIGRRAGVDEVIAGVLPDGKEAVIRQLQASGKVTMVGDGINDAPALTRADTGIAIGAGTDVAIDAADVVLMNSKLSDVPAAIRLSRATLRNIHENLFWAFIYNIIGIPLAAGLFIPFGLTLNPMFGAAAMSLSSFCVVSNALRLNLFDLHSTRHDHKTASPAAAPVQSAAENNKKSDAEAPEVKTEDHTMKKTLKVEGMMCGHCEARVKKALEALPEVDEAVVSHEAGTAIVTLNAEVADDVLKKAVEDQDYPVTGIQ